MTNNYRPRCREDFHVAVICALPLEYDAVALAFDEFWNEDRDIRGRPAGHDNYHKMGRIGSHNAVLVLLPNMGKVSAANETARLRLIYTGLKLAILTGICGGVPSPGTDDEILLGDIVISNSIVQYDLGRQYPGKFSRKDTVHDNLGRPSKDIRTLLAIFETHLGLNELQCRTIQILKKLQQTAVETNHRTCYDRPADGEDTLFKPDYPHRHRDQSTCSCDEISACDGAISASCEELQCNVGHRVLRRRLESKRKRQFEEGDITNAQESRIHIGRIGSGDTVMKSGEHRDRIAKEHSIIAFEMEGAGVWDEIPCVIVKAVCDYADSHKNKRWQDFAAATAASAMKALLEHYIQRNGPETAHTWFLVPYNENPGFVGRSEILDQVKRLFGHDQNQATVKPCSRVALYGLGGVGKTQIALAYVYWMKETHPGVSVFWVHASNAQRFRQAFASIAEECNIPGRDDPKADALLLVRKWLETKNSGQWLMVIDNADDTHLFSQIHGCHADMSTNAIEAKHNLGRYVPECAHGLILITTRNKQTGSRLAPGRPPIRIDSMSNDEADQLLRSMLEEEVNIISTEETLLLSSRLENLPLALAQAAAFILENDILINDYVQLLSESDSRLVDCLSEPFEAVGRDSGTPHALTATWIISSFEQIERQNAFASDVLSLLSLFDRQAIPKIFINNYYLQRTPQESEASQAAAVTKALGILKAFSFIKESKHQSVDMHRLVQMVTRKWLVNSRRMTEFAQQALRIVSNTYPYGKHESKEVCQEYLPHAYAVLRQEETGSQDGNKARAYLLHNVAGYYLYHGQWKEAEKRLDQAVELRREILGADHPDTLGSIANLASTYCNQGRWKEAESLDVQVMETRKTVLGAEHPDALSSIANLASTYWNQGRWKEAESLDVQVMETRKTVLGAEHPDTLSSIANLASTYCNQGRWKEAELLEVQVMEMSKTVLGAEHPDTLRSMANLAFSWKSQGLTDNAIMLMDQCAQARIRVLGPDHPLCASSFSTLRNWKAE